MPFIGPKPADTVLDSTLIADGSITSAKIADGTIVNADLNSSAAIATSKITGLAASATTDTTNAANIASGTIADARISASSVQQHATSFDDNKLVNDISTLALRQASNENKAAYNTNSMYVDVFQDSTGITNLTNANRNSNEYISTGSVTSSAYTLSKTGGTNTSVSVNSTTISGGGSGSGVYWYHTVSSPASYYDFQFIMNTAGGGAGPTFGCGVWLGSSNPDGYYFDQGSGNAKGYGVFNKNSSGGASDAMSFRYTVATKTFSNVVNSISGPSTGSGFASVSTTPLRFYFPMWIDSSPDWNVSYSVTEYTDSVNATGSFTSNNITAPSSTNKMGAIITYQDNAGTNTLNTDIVLKLSADGGSNYATATLTALPDFATGIKMAKVNDLSVTAGTSLKYKIEFANQASGSKEARIRGVSLQY